MIVKDLHISSVAHFDEVEMAFGPGMHLLYGPNEAGKTTLLELFIDLLFGGTPVTRDFYNSTSRLAGTFENATASYQLRRRRYRTGLVQIDGDDKSVAEDFVANWLKMDRQRYMQLYGFHHARLRSGGQSLLANEGDLGISLFEAGNGIPNVKQLLDTCRDKLTDLFHPSLRSNSTAELNRALRQYQEARNDERAARLKPAVWLAEASALEETQSRVEDMERQRKALDEGLRLAERVKRNLPNVQERHRVLLSLASLGSVHALSEAEEEEIYECLRERQRLDGDVERETLKLAKVRDALNEIHVDTDILQYEREIEALREDHSLFRSLKEDSITLAQAVATQERIWASKRDQLISAQVQSQVTIERIPLAVTYQLKQLHDKWQEVMRNLEVNQRQQALAQADASAKESQLADASGGTPISYQPLRDRMQAWRHQHVSSTKASALAQGVRDEWIALEGRLATQTVFEGNVDALMTTPLPLSETMREFAERMRNADAQMAECLRECRQAQSDLSRYQTEFIATEKAYDIPTEGDLAAARNHRDDGWRHIRVRLENPGQSTLDSSAYAADAGEDAIERAYERAVIAADELADRLRREADRVAKGAELQVAIDRTQGILAQLQPRKVELEQKRAALDDEWLALWASTTVQPLSPMEMSSWLSQFVQPLVRDYAAWQLREREANMARVAVTEAATALASWVVTYEFGLPDTILEFDDQLQWVERDMDLREQQAAARANAFAALTETRRKLSDLASEQHSLVATRSSVLDSYQSLRTTHPHWPVGLDEMSEYLTVWDRLCEGLEQLRHDSAHLADMKERMTKYETQVAVIAKAVGVTAQMGQAEESTVTFNRLSHRLDEAQTAKRTANQRSAAVEQQEQRIQDIQADRQRVQMTLSRYMAKFDIADEGALRPLTEASRQHRDWTTHVQRLEQAILAAGDGHPLDVLLSEVEQDGDMAELAVRIERSKVEIAEHDAQLKRVNVQLGEQKQALASHDGTDASAAQYRQSALMSAQAVNAKWEEVVRTQTMLVLLEQALVRYRELNQAGVLQRAADLFRRMTLERYVQLDLDDHPTSPRILAVQRNGEKRTAGQLSDGTIDQLHFALRLAFLHEQAASTGETLPLIMDDVLIHFDDERAKVAIEILDEVANHTQVLYFTHHRHLVEDVATTANASRLQTHELQTMVRYL